MNTVVLDWYDLSEKQVRDASIVLGGSGTEIIKVQGDLSEGAISDIRKRNLAVITVVLWGSTLIDKVIRALKSLGGGCDPTFVGLISDRLLSFRVIPRYGPQYDEETDEFVDGEFHLGEYHQSGSVVVLPWSYSEASRTLSVLQKQNINVPIYCVLDEFVLQFSRGLEMSDPL